MSTPEIAVVIPTFNRRDLLRRALDSVLGQTFGEFELIVVDDGSTDETAAMLAAAADRRLRWFRQPRRGRCAARNHGVQQACAEFVTFLDSDDEARPNWLQRLVQTLREEGADLVSCGALHVDQQQQPIVHRQPERLGPVYAELVMLIRAGTFALRRDRFLALGGYAEELSMCEHTELALRIAEDHRRRPWRIAHLDEALVRIHEPGGTLNHAADRLPDAVHWILDRHEAAFARDPAKAAQFLTIAGVEAARSGKWDEARAWFGRAIRRQPASPRGYARWMLTCLPVLARQVWRPRPCAGDAVPLESANGRAVS